MFGHLLRRQWMYLTVLVLGIASVLLSLMLILPTTSAALARAAWARGYPAAAYYLNHSDANLALREGNYYFAGGAYNPARASSAYKLALRLHPGLLWGHYQLARIDFVEGKFDQALAEADAEMAANPNNLRALYVRGLIYLYRLEPGDLALAEADFRRFAAWAPGEWGGYNDLAFTLQKEGKYAESAAVLDTALAKVPGGQSNPWLWNSLGTADLNQLHYREARASFQKALALSQSLTEVDWRRAYSGDDPALDAAGLVQFRAALQANLQTATAGTAL